MKECKTEKAIFDHYMHCVDCYLNEHRHSLLKRSSARRSWDESFMRRIEECMDVPEQGADDFRRTMAAFFWHRHYNKRTIAWDSNPALAKGIREYLKIHPEPELPEYGNYRSIDAPHHVVGYAHA